MVSLIFDFLISAKIRESMLERLLPRRECPMLLPEDQKTG
jgi:hypothetical protein